MRGRNDNFEFEIVEHIAVISKGTKGWVKEINLVSYNRGKPKIDIRDWSGDHQKMGKGITLTEEEANTVAAIIAKRYMDQKGEEEPEPTPKPVPKSIPVAVAEPEDPEEEKDEDETEMPSKIRQIFPMRQPQPQIVERVEPTKATTKVTKKPVVNKQKLQNIKTPFD